MTRLLREAQAAGVRLAIASTTSRVNADALLGAQLGRDWQQHFAAVICGEDAPQRKPDPQCYLRCLEALDLDPDEVVAIEDSPNGLAAANAAGIATLLTRSVFFASHAYPGAMAVCDGLEDPAVPAPNLAGARPARVDLAQLREWHAAWGEPVQAAA